MGRRSSPLRRTVFLLSAAFHPARYRTRSAAGGSNTTARSIENKRRGASARGRGQPGIASLREREAIGRPPNGCRCSWACAIGACAIIGDSAAKTPSRRGPARGLASWCQSKKCYVGPAGRLSRGAVNREGKVPPVDLRRIFGHRSGVSPFGENFIKNIRSCRLCWQIMLSQEPVLHVSAAGYRDFSLPAGSAPAAESRPDRGARTA
ncbi:hypothetical protein Pla111_18410 [Botrimarina hoheduenensis]|uniref:Uncharacterized protein n=1 Tax=Botrimarina hoheduenensis TaxID=2528000 RepID=A0A5C5W7Q6_9BACT|nr:hypothetical protein Pla111_18410 [Botrimarina hoheduenensis]